jgi:hypothetical protein
MKHIKPFNEAITWDPTEFKQELTEFCEMNLDGQKPHSLTTEFDSSLWGINIKILDKI